MIEAKYIDGDEKKLDGPVPHDHFPPKVKSKMPVICQEVRMSHCSPVNDASQYSDSNCRDQRMTAEPSREVSEVINSPGEGEAEEEGREVAEVGGRKQR